jgi:hypothetical protein
VTPRDLPRAVPATKGAAASQEEVPATTEVVVATTGELEASRAEATKEVEGGPKALEAISESEAIRLAEATQREVEIPEGAVEATKGTMGESLESVASAPVPDRQDCRLRLSGSYLDASTSPPCRPFQSFPPAPIVSGASNANTISRTGSPVTSIASTAPDFKSTNSRVPINCPPRFLSSKGGKRLKHRPPNLCGSLKSAQYILKSLRPAIELASRYEQATAR